MEKPKKYKVLISEDALVDIKETKRYILETFKYRQYAENFSKNIKKAIKELNVFPTGYESTGYVIEGLEIYFKPYSTYLIFFCYRKLRNYRYPCFKGQNVLEVHHKQNEED